MVPACSALSSRLPEVVVHKERHTEVYKVGQHNHRHAPDQIHKYECDTVADLTFQYAEYTENHADDAGKKQAIQRQQQRLAHCFEQYVAVISN